VIEDVMDVMESLEILWELNTPIIYVQMTPPQATETVNVPLMDTFCAGRPAGRYQAFYIN